MEEINSFQLTKGQNLLRSLPTNGFLDSTCLMKNRNMTIIFKETYTLSTIKKYSIKAYND